MDIRPVIDGFAAAPQLTLDEVADAAAQGYRTLICNRPDGEEPGQPSADEMRAMAEANGMTFHYLPVFPGSFPPALVTEMRDVMDGAEAPVLAYCRSGTRSTFLWGLSQAGLRPAPEILAAGASAGYDLRPIAPALG
ncbi:TIGR01244 family sulfur transferase [Frigidibacter sp. MR17.14]|uniref:TIGR01244 family sulfur transferase n=1 Tax=Frigidibacter sp. MR17.14 TaxID=3126509 RepID=UPI003012FD30